MRTQKFSSVGRCHLKESITRMRGDMSGASYSLNFFRPIVRGLLLAIAAGERIPPEFVRVTLAGCLKAVKTKVNELLY